MIIWTIGIILAIAAIFTLTPAKRLLFIIICLSTEQAKNLRHKRERKKLNKQTKAIPIEWADLSGEDFSFSEKWTYDEATLANLAQEDHRLSEEELCRKWEQKEDEKRDDYVFYSKTHYPYTLQIDSLLSHIAVEKIKKNMVECQSGQFAIEDMPYACLNLLIAGKACYPVIAPNYNDYQIQKSQFLGHPAATASEFELISPCVEGTIKIDKLFWEKAHLKAAYSFVFVHPARKYEYTLAGKIYSPIKWMDAVSPYVKDEKQYEYMVSLSSKYR